MNFAGDVRYAFRTLLRTPIVSAVSVLMLALGIGITSVVLGIVDTLWFRSLPVHDADSLVWVWESNNEQLVDQTTVSLHTYRRWSELNSCFARIAAAQSWSFALAGEHGAEEVTGALVSANWFSTLGVSAQMGRTFTVENERPGNNNVVVLSDGLWRRRFGADTGVIGKSINLLGPDDPKLGYGRQFRVIGIMPPTFGFRTFVSDTKTAPSHLWIPLVVDEAISIAPKARSLQVIAGLKEGVTVAQAQAAMSIVATALERDNAAGDRGWSVRVVGLREQFVKGVRLPLALATGAALLLLIVTCVNLMSLLLMRASYRRREVAVRLALGATRSDLVKQFMMESLLLSIAGGGMGIVFAVWGLDIVRGSLDVPWMEGVGLSGRTLIETMGLCVLTTIACGSYPAIRLSGIDLNSALKGQDGAYSGRIGEGRLRRALVAIQVSLALVLSTGAGLLCNSFIRLSSVDPGFDRKNVMTMRISLPERKYQPQRQAVFFQQMIQRVGTLPGVKAAGATTCLPLTGLHIESDVRILGSGGQPHMNSRTGYDAVSPGYFETIGTRIIRGRSFSESDNTNAPPVILVNARMASKYWGGEDPLGKQMVVKLDDRPVVREIVGIVENARHADITSEPEAHVYVPYLQIPWSAMTIVARATADPINLASPMREIVQSLDRDEPVGDLRTLEQVYLDSIVRRRLLLFVFILTAGTVLLVAAAGVYGMTAHAVVQRKREIGIRLALGAAPDQMVRMIILQGLRPIIVGVGVGSLAALGLAHLLSGLLFGVGATDPLTFGVICVGLCGAGLLSAYVAAHSASRVDPLVSLRSE